MKRSLATIVALGLMVMVSCTYLGQENATWVQKFYEVDQIAIATLESSTVAMRVVREREVVVPREVVVTLGAQAMILREGRYQVRGWVDACGMGLDTCPPKERIQLGIDSVVASIAVVRSVVREVYSYGE